jgi:hypothetical protein
MHDGGIKAAHFTGHLLHEKSFWSILAILTLLAALFTLVVLFGDKSPDPSFGVPLPYGRYF